ncbi:SpoIID/LytB domain-containing protein [Croceimicrobium sp.]|uniref:SpoIID/LytB domain-containing protein n=1 Tax=Croceimicrobium sp. TaxID=2828340 RepID=UPI003BAB8403
MHRFLIGVFLILSFTKLQALDLKVRLFSDQAVQRFLITPDSSKFTLLALRADGSSLDTIYDIYPKDPARTFVVSVKGKYIQLKLGDQTLGEFEGLYFSGLDSLHQFRITANKKNRAYYGGVRALVRGGQLQVVNIVDLEHYVAGVVESEAGHVPELEFFKAQAVLARTFALRNLGKHEAEGYNLKDDVSSQVYFSKAHYTHKDLILKAVSATRDTVLVNIDCDLILSVFHANSGGMTVNSEDVWLKPVPELKSKIDSFSIGVGSYSWEKRINSQRFFSYFARMFGVKNDAELQKALLNFEQKDRQRNFSYKGKSLKLTTVRHDFKLRSTYFTIELDGDDVLLKGKGFGHGVGLSQDGAIEMSKRGYGYQSILCHYFFEVELENKDFILDN